MKRSEFEQQIESMRLRHEQDIAVMNLKHEHALEEMRVHGERSDASHQNHLEAMRVMGEEIRTTISHAKDTMMPLYEHLGPEQTYALLKNQLEQSVAMVTHLGEKALAVAEKKVEADAAARFGKSVEDTLKALTHEVERIYFAGRDDADADADAQAAEYMDLADAMKDSIARAFRDTGREASEDSGSDDDDLVS